MGLRDRRLGSDRRTLKTLPKHQAPAATRTKSLMTTHKPPKTLTDWIQAPDTLPVKRALMKLTTLEVSLRRAKPT